jgi:hypothetical protein
MVPAKTANIWQNVEENSLLDELIIQERGVAIQGVSTIDHDRRTSVLLFGTFSTCRAFTRKTLELPSKMKILLFYNDLSYINKN